MDLDNIKADIEYLEDLYSATLVELEKADSMPEDVLNEKIAWLDTIQRQIDKKTAILTKLEEVEIERSKSKIDQLKAETDRMRAVAEEKTKKLDPNVALRVFASIASMAAIGFVELKGNGYLNERLLKKSDEILKS